LLLLLLLFFCFFYLYLFSFFPSIADPVLLLPPLTLTALTSGLVAATALSAGGANIAVILIFYDYAFFSFYIFHWFAICSYIDCIFFYDW